MRWQYLKCMFKTCLNNRCILVGMNQKYNEQSLWFGIVILFIYSDFLYDITLKMDRSQTWMAEFMCVLKLKTYINELKTYDIRKCKDAQIFLLSIGVNKFNECKSFIKYASNLNKIIHLNQIYWFDHYISEKEIFFLQNCVKWYDVESIKLNSKNDKNEFTKIKQSLLLMKKVFNMNFNVNELDILNVIDLLKNIDTLNNESFWNNYSKIDANWKTLMIYCSS